MTQYLVCTTPRTGSSFLCYLLETTGLAGMRPLPVVGQEYLLELRIGADAGANWDELELRQYLEQAFRKSGGNGAAGFKVMWGAQMEYVEKRMQRSRRYRGFSAHDLPRFLPEGTKYVWLVRRDRVRQAISWARAMQTQCWNTHALREYRGVQVFDLRQIRRKIAVIERHNLEWKSFFDRNGIRPLTIVYEEFLEQPEQTVREILRYLGVAPPADFHVSAESDHRAHDVNEEWVRRFERIESSAFFPRIWHSLSAYPRWLAGSIVLARLRARAATRARRRASA
jgi:LPS sulfotransferase NodH